MYSQLIIFISLFILATVLHKSIPAFRKVLCYNTLLTIFIIIILGSILFVQHIKVNRRIHSNKETFAGHSNIESEEVEEEEDVIDNKHNKDSERFYSIDILISSLKYDSIKNKESLKKNIIELLKKLDIKTENIYNIELIEGSTIIRIIFNDDIKKTDGDKMLSNLQSNKHKFILDVKLKDGSTKTFKNNDFRIAPEGFFDWLKSNNAKNTNDVHSTSANGGIVQHDLEGVGNIYAPRIIIKNKESSNRRATPIEILNEKNDEDKKYNIMKAQHYKNYGNSHNSHNSHNDYGNLKFGNFEKSRVETKCGNNKETNEKIKKNLGEKTYYPGYSYMPPSNWDVPQKRPDVCISQKKCMDHPVGVFDKGTPADALEYYGVGSIMPKFTYSQESEYSSRCPPSHKRHDNKSDVEGEDN